MKRYQVYLDPHSVSILDEIEGLSNISRSKLIRGAIDRFAEQLVKVFSYRPDKPPKMIYLDKLVGAIKLKTKKPTNFANSVDDIYYQD